jgi:murein DD-endopeptidase MepM/ murein hydrolase activator NlpD
MTRARAARPSALWLLAAAASGFLAGVFVMSGPRAANAPAPERTLVAPAPPSSPPAPVSATPTIGADLPAELRQRHLTLPVQGLEAGDLRDTFDEMRGGSRRHEALDILAPRDTPVLAVENGTVAKLFLSDAGGMTIYQFDPTGMYAYYYAHLERYADGLKDGDRVQRGQVIGYVGTSGNAPRDTPHLHFAIFRLTDEKRWWQGTAIDPYPILK